MTLQSARMATPTPTNMSDHSVKKSPSKDDGGDQEIQPKKLGEQEESPLQKIYDNDSAVVMDTDETIKSSSASEDEAALRLVTDATDITKVVGSDSAAEEEESGRERLKKHRMEMAGRVWIPDIWGQEDLLKDWIDCTTFDASLVNNSILSARAALMQQRATTTSPANNPTLLTRIENRC